MVQRGDEILPGWRVRFVSRSDSRWRRYRVEQNGTHAFLKILRTAPGTASPTDPDDLPREATLLKAVEGEGVPAVLDSGSLDPGSKPFLLLELIPGETLAGLLAREVALPATHARGILRSLLETVKRLHGQEDPVFHNRLTPDHVMLDVRQDPEGTPILVGFGGARRASDGPAGVPADADRHYLPSESFEELGSSPAVDLFSLGALWFHMLFGVPPWSLAVEKPGTVEDSLKDLIARRRQSAPPMPAHSFSGRVPDRDLRLIQKALSFQPSDRFADADAFLAALDAKGPVRSASTSISVQRGHGEGEADAPLELEGEAEASLESGGESADALFGLDRAGGMAELKAALIRDVVEPLRNPEKYRRFGVGIPNGILLYGPPGCGKTFFAECLGEEIGRPFEAIRPSDVASVFVHGTQQRIAKLFEDVREKAPCVLFLDEVDALVPNRGSATSHHYASEVNEWLTQLNRVGDDQVFVIAATNRPDRLDSAATRTGRLDKTFYVGLPDRSAREAMLRIHLRGRPLDPGLDLADLARRTEDRTASDLRFLVDDAARGALAEDAPTITSAHLNSAIARNPPSVSREELRGYEQIRSRFRRGGGGKPRAGRIGFQPPKEAGRSQP